MQSLINANSMVIPTWGQTQALPAEGINHGVRFWRDLELCAAGRKSSHHWTIQ
jgi:hypothetical protein